ncbi:MAG TPA: hypothetical protein VGO11_16730 [Chthoniobacteraceae bacterium]|jgi:hypothetical protein|nr:hypothetical protein [Chthoniobacteraceae bacterium]
MKSITRRKALPLVATALASVLAGQAYGATPENPGDENTFPVFSPDLEALKKSMQVFAVRWWTIKFDRKTYHFCRANRPFFEVSRYDVHGWVQASGEDDKRLFHVWSVRTHGIGDIRVDIDEAVGTVTVVALEGKLKGKQMAFYALSAST